MAWLFDLLALAAGLLLVAAAFLYLVAPRQAQQMLKRFRVPLFTVLAVLMVVAIISAGERWPVLIALAGASIVAYLLRESRKPRRQHQHSFGGAERKPVLPSTGLSRDEEDTEQKEP